jgi:hypothetical protein
MPFRCFQSYLSPQRKLFLGWSVAFLVCIGLGTGFLYDGSTTIQFDSTHPLKIGLPGALERAYLRAMFTYWDLFDIRPVPAVLDWAYYTKWIAGIALVAGARPLWK